MDTKTMQALTKRQKKQKFRDQLYKKPFGSKKEGHGFAEIKKQKAIHSYNKLLRKEEAKAKHKPLEKKPFNPPSAGPSNEATDVTKKKKRKLNTIEKTKNKIQEKVREKETEKNEAAKKFKAKSEALAKYQSQKKEKYKLMCKKNFRGQPKVAGQMELLLQKIEAARKT